MKFERLGWAVAAALAGGMFVMGFQTPGQKIGSVDLAKVFDSSQYAGTKRNDLSTAQKNRTAILQFIGENKGMKSEDAARYAAIAVKTAPTAAEKAEMERIAQDARNSLAKQKELATKPSLTPAETQQMAEFTSRMNQNNQLLQDLSQQYSAELQQLQGSLRDDTLERVRAAVREVAAKQGYTVVFASDVAPYTANDITDEALKVMNARK